MTLSDYLNAQGALHTVSQNYIPESDLTAAAMLLFHDYELDVPTSIIPTYGDYTLAINAYKYETLKRANEIELSSYETYHETGNDKYIDDINGTDTHGGTSSAAMVHGLTTTHSGTDSTTLTLNTNDSTTGNSTLTLDTTDTITNDVTLTLDTTTADTGEQSQTNGARNDVTLTSNWAYDSDVAKPSTQVSTTTGEQINNATNTSSQTRSGTEKTATIGDTTRGGTEKTDTTADTSRTGTEKTEVSHGLATTNSGTDTTTETRNLTDTTVNKTNHTGNYEKSYVRNIDPNKLVEDMRRAANFSLAKVIATDMIYYICKGVY